MQIIFKKVHIGNVKWVGTVACSNLTPFHLVGKGWRAILPNIYSNL